MTNDDKSLVTTYPGYRCFSLQTSLWHKRNNWLPCLRTCPTTSIFFTHLWAHPEQACGTEPTGVGMLYQATKVASTHHTPYKRTGGFKSYTNYSTLMICSRSILTLVLVPSDNGSVVWQKFPWGDAAHISSLLTGTLWQTKYGCHLSPIWRINDLYWGYLQECGEGWLTKVEMTKRQLHYQGHHVWQLTKLEPAVHCAAHRQLNRLERSLPRNSVGLLGSLTGFCFQTAALVSEFLWAQLPYLRGILSLYCLFWQGGA